MQSRRPGLVFQPRTHAALLHGARQICAAISPTLGPIPRTVAIEAAARNAAPELLDKGALIARRITDLRPADADVGAMLLRHLLWRQYELIGDGTATAALLFESLFADCVRHLGAGYDAQGLRRHLLAGLTIIQRQLKADAFSLEGEALLEKVALAICHDDELASILGEALATLGPYGKVDVRRGYGRRSEREYVQGVLWPGGLHSSELIFDKLNDRSLLRAAAIFLSDLEFDDPRDILPIIDAASQRGKALILVCKQLSARGVGLLTHINATHEHFQAIAVKLPSQPLEQMRMLDDLTLMSGGRRFLQEGDHELGQLGPEDLGSIQEAYANKNFFCVIRDRDDGESRATALLRLEAHYQRTTDLEARADIRERIGHLMGASATIRVGGSSEHDIKRGVEAAESAVKTLRSALEQGLVLGGGCALLRCAGALEACELRASSDEEKTAYAMLMRALERPARQIHANAGLKGFDRAALVKAAQENRGLDARSGKLVDLVDAGILDAYEVLGAALDAALRTAALALTIDVIVQHRQPEFSSTP